MFLAESLVLIIFQSAEEGIIQHVMTIDNRHSIGFKGLRIVAVFCHDCSRKSFFVIHGMIHIVIIIHLALQDRIINRCICNVDPCIDIRIFCLQDTEIHRNLYRCFLSFCGYFRLFLHGYRCFLTQLPVFVFLNMIPHQQSYDACHSYQKYHKEYSK